MSDPLFRTESPFALEMVARAARDRYLAQVVKVAARALWTAVFGTRQTAHDAAEAFQACYVRNNVMVANPDVNDLESRRCNDHDNGASSAA